MNRCYTNIACSTYYTCSAYTYVHILHDYYCSTRGEGLVEQNNFLPWSIHNRKGRILWDLGQAWLPMLHISLIALASCLRLSSQRALLHRHSHVITDWQLKPALTIYIQNGFENLQNEASEAYVCGKEVGNQNSVSKSKMALLVDVTSCKVDQADQASYFYHLI